MSLDQFRLDGRIAAVTGGARGIGFAIAELAATAGADIAIIDILEEGSDSAARLEAASGRTVRAYRADLRDPVAARAVAEDVERDFGRVGVLFNCIGINPNTDVLEIPAEEWRDVINVNVNAQFFIAQAFARQMARNGGGSIVSIGSDSGFIVDKPQPQAHYNTSKAAVHRLTEALAAELKGSITVNAVLPSTIDTPANRAAMPDADVKSWVTPDELAEVILFLAGTASSGVPSSARRTP